MVRSATGRALTGDWLLRASLGIFPSPDKQYQGNDDEVILIIRAESTDM